LATKPFKPGLTRAAFSGSFHSAPDPKRSNAFFWSACGLPPLWMDAERLKPRMTHTHIASL